MLLGPVFSNELLTTARRKRYYAVRFVYGAILLFFVWMNDPVFRPSYSAPGRSVMSIQEVARLGQALFYTLITVQTVAVIVLTPALVAGVIAEERQRKTLHYLLASRLTSAEIVLGKLGARVLHVLVFLGIGLPVLSLLSLFGGVDPRIVALAFAMTVSTALFLAALCILISTHARRPREAISLSYLVVLSWLFVPSFITIIMPFLGGNWITIYHWIRPVNEWIAPSSPMYLVITAGPRGFRGQAAIVEMVAWMFALQCVYGLLFVLIAVLRVRPVGRNEGAEGARGWQGRLQRLSRMLPRRECGDDAMMWKERYTSRTSALTKLVTSLVVLAALAGLAYLTVDYGMPAFAELANYGYGSESPQPNRISFNGYLRGMCTLIYVLWALAVASSASAGVTSEREGDTWTSLVSTPLNGTEILRAKLIGAIWATRWAGVVLAGLWVVGLVAGSIHPIGLFAVVIETVVFVWFASALGTYLSLRSRSSGRALISTMAILVVSNGAYMMCCIPLWQNVNSGLVLFGITWLMEGLSLLSYPDVQAMLHDYNPRQNREMAVSVFACLFAYTTAATLLTGLSFRRFDIEADRPRRDPNLTPGPGIVFLDNDDVPEPPPKANPDEDPAE